MVRELTSGLTGLESVVRELTSGLTGLEGGS